MLMGISMYMLGRDIFFKYAKESFEERHLTNNGPAVKELECQLAEFHGVNNCIAFSDCYTTMYITLHCLARPGKKEVVVPFLSCRQITDIIAWAGLSPCFYDVAPDVFSLYPELARASINENTDLILAVHPIAGLCDIDGLENLAKEYSLPLFFDSVDAFGSTHKGGMLGGFGDCEAFSMPLGEALKNSELGYITTNNDDLAHTLKVARAFGFFGHDNIIMLGHNAKLNELHAALGLAALADIKRRFTENSAKP